jgi:hypothetical protein
MGKEKSNDLLFDWKRSFMNQFAIAIPELFTPNVLHQFEKKKKKALSCIYLFEVSAFWLQRLKVFMSVALL